ncbi:MAG: hypothetical protein NTX15_08795 [Candidatus Kapabacteria bacterium]|nr:hypothetical protein [Candidatus Kapabacteria bacterium]
MLKKPLTIAFLLLSAVSVQAQYYNPLAVDLTRAILKDLFESNAVPYIQPMVNTINATSNARFYDRAYVPRSVDRPYVRVSVNGMVGYINEDQRWYTPRIDLGPRVNVVVELAKYGKIVIGQSGPTYEIGPLYSDTLGLATMLVQELFRDAQDSGYIVVPDSAATLFGYRPNNKVLLPTNQQLLTVLHNRPEYKLLDSAGKAGLDALLTNVNLVGFLTLPPGVNMTKIIAAVPQIEIGSFYGTELLIRYLPPVEFDPNVGKFSFWGIGIKHSLSQYFPERWFDLAIQGVYQGTWLRNTVGFTESKLDADATIFSGNIHASKNLWEMLDIYTGISLEKISVTSTYTYVLPQETQIELGLLPKPPVGEPAVPTPEQPGDQKPQTSIVTAQNTNVKWTIGASFAYGPMRIALDYSVSTFNIFSAGLSYTF